MKASHFLAILFISAALPAAAQTDVNIPDSVHAATHLEAVGDDAADGYVYDAAAFQPTLRTLSWQQTVEQRIDAVVARHKGYNVGIYVYDLTTDSVLYTLKAQQRFIPASNQKLLVSIAALSELGAQYDFNTTAFTDGRVEHDASRRRFLSGDIYICGSFDPLASSDVYERIGEKILSMGIDSIAGSIYADSRKREKLGSRTKWSHESVPSLLMNYLRRHGVRFSETSTTGFAPKPGRANKKIASCSTPLTSVLQRMMKSSDNFYAECMFLNLFPTDSDDWSYQACADCIRSVMRKAGVNPDDGAIFDGSGLSHSNKVTPEMIGRLLQYAYSQRRIFGPLYESLPIAGVDGTLGRRMSTGPAYKNVHAKTGTVSGVSTLSGYVLAQNGHKLVFSILNNNISSSSLGRTFQNEVCQELAR